jgi:hypothetical protein
MGSIYPITFSFPEEKIITELPNKRKLLSSLIPGDTRTYIYNNEEDYYNEYKQSFFATTTKKAGWDCMRHYEIIANGCIPYFPDIQKCPEQTMALLPKDLIQEGNTLYQLLHTRNECVLNEDETQKYTMLQQKLLTHMREHLTTRKMVDYILKKTSHTDAKRVLFLSGNTEPDYLRCVTLHGFKTVFGTNCHDYPIVPHIYKTSTINYSRLYGKGITYTNLLDQTLHNTLMDARITDTIINKEFDIVIYGSYHRGMPFYDLVQTVYSPSEIILLCGEDIHNCDYMQWVNKGHHVFVREL